MSNIIYQTGTINSLLEAVYSGDKTVGDILKHGCFGLINDNLEVLIR
jgi:alpha-acetolactate decarboxylase